MPRKYTTRPRGRPNPKRLNKPQSAAVATIARKVIKSAVESKKHDDSNGGLAASRLSTNVGYMLSSVPTAERDGDIINPVSLELKYTIKANATTPLSCYVRVLVVRWLDQEACNAIQVNALLDTVFASDTTRYFMNPYRFDASYRKRFVPVYDKVHTVIPGEKDYIYMSKYIKIPKTSKILYSTGSAVTGKNQYIVYFLTNQSAGASPPTITYRTRLIYKDP